MKPLSVLIILTFIAVLISCSETPPIVITFNDDMEKLGEQFSDTALKSPAHSGKHFYRVNETTKYASTRVFSIPDSLRDYDVTVIVSAWLRESEHPNEGKIAIQLKSQDGQVTWNEFQLKGNNFQANKWLFIKDSIFISFFSYRDQPTDIVVFGFKGDGPDNLDVDDMKIEYKFSK